MSPSRIKTACCHSSPFSISCLVIKIGSCDWCIFLKANCGQTNLLHFPSVSSYMILAYNFCKTGKTAMGLRRLNHDTTGSFGKRAISLTVCTSYSILDTFRNWTPPRFFFFAKGSQMTDENSPRRSPSTKSLGNTKGWFTIWPSWSCRTELDTSADTKGVPSVKATRTTMANN